MQAQIFAFLVAGYDTTATIINMMCYYLALHSSIQANLQREIDQHFPDLVGAKLLIHKKSTQPMHAAMNGERNQLQSLSRCGVSKRQHPPMAPGCFICYCAVSPPSLCLKNVCTDPPASVSRWIPCLGRNCSKRRHTYKSQWETNIDFHTQSSRLENVFVFGRHGGVVSRKDEIPHDVSGVVSQGMSSDNAAHVNEKHPIDGKVPRTSQWQLLSLTNATLWPRVMLTVSPTGSVSMKRYPHAWCYEICQ